MLQHPVILVNDEDEVIGYMEKEEAHRKGLLHRAFSVFIFNSMGELLLQQRAVDKYHSGGLWTNSCCSHPRPGEDILTAAHRRLMEELGFDCDMEEQFSFTYHAVLDKGMIEHEYDHVVLGYYDGEIRPDSREIADFRFLPVARIEEMLQLEPHVFTTWFQIAFPKMIHYLFGQAKVRDILM